MTAPTQDTPTPHSPLPPVRSVLLLSFGRRAAAPAGTTGVLRASVAAVLVASAAACMSAERVSEPGLDFEAFGFSFADPANDTLSHETSSSRVARDLLGVSGTVDGASLTITLTFSTTVAPWSQQAAASVDGFIDLDLDERSDTGIPGAAGEFGGSAPLGAEYYVSLRDVEPGYVALIDVATYQHRIAPATWSGSTMSITLPRSRLGDADGQFRLSVVVGHPELPATDFAPSDGFYTVHR